MAYYVKVTAKIASVDGEALGSSVATLYSATDARMSLSKQTLTVGGTKTYSTGSLYYQYFQAVISSSDWVFDHFNIDCPTRTSYPKSVNDTGNPTGQWSFYYNASASQSTSTALPITVTLYVKSAGPKTVTVTFDPNGGSVTPTSKSVTVGNTYGDLPTPSRSGSFSFVGWFTSSSGGSQVSPSTEVTQQSDHTIYAHWTTQYTLTYDANGGSNPPASQTFTSSVTLSTQKPKRQYKNFLGWSTDRGATTPSYYGGSTYTFSRSTVLYAVWGQVDVIVYFNGNGGSVSPLSKSVVAGDAYGTLPSPSWGSKVFVGWYTAASGGTLVTSSSQVTNTSSHTLYASWVSSEGVALRYSSSGRDYCSFTTMFLFSDAATLSVSGMPDNVVVCPSCRYVRCIDIRSGSTVLSPSWVVMNTAYFNGTVEASLSGSVGGSSPLVSTSNGGPTFGFTNGTVASPRSATFSIDEAALAAVGYRAFGWFVGQRPRRSAPDPRFSGITGGRLISGVAYTMPEDAFMGTGSKNWYVFIPLVRKIDYIVMFDPAGGIISSGTYFKRVYKGEPYGELPIPNRPGYSFSGWYDESGVRISSSTILSRLGDHTLTARWTAETVTRVLTFNANGGVVSPALRNVVVGSVYGSLPTPSWAGHIFGGWYDTIAGGRPVSSTNVMPDDDVTIYARWAAPKLSVTFDPSGGEVDEPVREVTEGKQIGRLPKPWWSGHKFAGWFTARVGGTEITKEYVPRGSVTVYAHWTENSIKWWDIVVS